jgi:hypothetical protein
MLASRRTAPHDPIPTVSRGRIHTSFDAPRKSTDYVPAPAPRATRFASRFQRERRDAASIDDRQYRSNQRERDVRGSLHTGRDQGGSAPHIAQADTDIDRHCWPNRRSNGGPETGPFSLAWPRGFVHGAIAGSAPSRIAHRELPKPSNGAVSKCAWRHLSLSLCVPALR